MKGEGRGGRPGETFEGGVAWLLWGWAASPHWDFDSGRQQTSRPNGQDGAFGGAGRPGALKVGEELAGSGAFADRGDDMVAKPWVNAPGRRVSPGVLAYRDHFADRRGLGHLRTKRNFPQMRVDGGTTSAPSTRWMQTPSPPCDSLKPPPSRPATALHKNRPSLCLAAWTLRR